MYTVVWCNQEGIQQQKPCDNLEDAYAGYNYVNESYDGADILDENGNSIKVWEACRDRPYILRRTANYPPDMLYHLGIITQDEYDDLLAREWDEQKLLSEYKVVAYG